MCLSTQHASDDHIAVTILGVKNCILSNNNIIIFRYI